MADAFSTMWENAARYLGVDKSEILVELEYSQWNPLLTEREKQILQLRFGLDRGEPRTLEEVGEFYNLTQNRISQIVIRALRRIGTNAPLTDRSDLRWCRVCKRRMFSERIGGGLNSRLRTLYREGFCSRKCQLGLGIKEVL